MEEKVEIDFLQFKCTCCKKILEAIFFSKTLYFATCQVTTKDSESAMATQAAMPIEKHIDAPDQRCRSSILFASGCALAKT